MNEVPMNTANTFGNMLASNMLNGLNLGDHLHKVRGIEGMNAFQTKPSSEYALFEEDSNIFCFKTTDEQNHASERYFAFQEITKEEALQTISPYLMKGKLGAFKENVLSAIRGELSSFKEEILNAQQSVRNGNKTYNNQQRNRNAATESEQQ